MAKPHEVHRARLALEEAIRVMFAARREVRPPWGECTREAQYYRDLDVSSLAELRDAAEKLRRLAWRPPAERKEGLWPALWRLQRAWANSHVALDGFYWARSTMKPGDAALETVRSAVDTLFR
jgi:hypothetical protein